MDDEESITGHAIGIIVLTVVIGAAFILAACSHTYPESPTVEFDYAHCTSPEATEMGCEPTLNEAKKY